MKYLCTILVIFISISVNAQDVKEKNKKLFVRVYNIEGSKITKGKLQHVADTYVLLMKNDKRIEVPANNIGTIKTRHTGGHSILVSASIGAGIGAIVGIATENPDGLLGYTAGEGALIFGGIGALGGAIVGSIFGSTKPKKTFVINGDINNYNEFKIAMGF